MVKENTLPETCAEPPLCTQRAGRPWDREVRPGLGAVYLREADQHQEGEDVGVLQLERQLLDAVVCEGGNDVPPPGRTAERAQDLRHGARPVQAHAAGRQELREAAGPGLTLAPAGPPRGTANHTQLHPRAMQPLI